MSGATICEQRNYTGAVNRFRDVITKYQTTRHVEEALMRLTEAYMALGITNEAQTAAAVLGHNFPDSPLVQGCLCAARERRPRSRARIAAPISAAPSRASPRVVVGVVNPF